jgi:Arc/MetJ family transcription regulator
MVFKRVGDGRPYPDHGLSSREWSAIRPTRVPLSDLVTTRSQLDLSVLLVEDSTYFGDLFAHVVKWRGDLYLEDGLHRALRAALSGHGDAMLHARIHEIADDVELPVAASA